MCHGEESEKICQSFIHVSAKRYCLSEHKHSLCALYCDNVKASGSQLQ